MTNALPAPSGFTAAEQAEGVVSKGDKRTNPKDALGIKKAYQSVLPRPVLWEVEKFMTDCYCEPLELPVAYEVGLGMLEGGLKYGRHNYRVVGVRASVYFDAFCRHADAYRMGQDTDPDSGLSHLTKGMSTIVVIRDSEMHGKMVDDRAPRCGFPAASFFTKINGYIGLKSSLIANYRLARGFMDAWWEGVDECDGISPLSCAFGVLAHMRSLEMQGLLDDDRTKHKFAEDWLDQMNAKAAALIGKYDGKDGRPAPKPAYTWQDA